MTLKEYMEQKKVLQQKLDNAKLLRKEWFEEYINSLNSERKAQNYKRAAEEVKNILNDMFKLFDELHKTDER